MITLNTVYFIAGLLFAAFAISNLRDSTNPKRFVNALFWGIYAATFLVGTQLPHFVTGCMAILLAVIAGTGQLGKGKTDADRPEVAVKRVANAKRFGNKLFIPALIIPVLTLIGTLTLKYTPLVETKNVNADLAGTGDHCGFHRGASDVA